MEPPVSPYAWEEDSRPFHITIKDILNLEAGESLELFSLDRDVLDTSCDEKYNEPGRTILPSQFFREGYFWTFTKTGIGIKGNLKWVQETGADYDEFHIEKWPGGLGPVFLAIRGWGGGGL